LYVFGGKDSEGRITNILKYLSIEPKVYKWKYPAVKGTPPEPRYNHSSVFHEAMGILIIYGGKNEKLFELNHDVCLNDIRILNLEHMCWSPVSSYGNIPDIGRYHHATVMAGSKLLIFGGVGLSQFADDEVKAVDFSKKRKYSKKVKLNFFRSN